MHFNTAILFLVLSAVVPVLSAPLLTAASYNGARAVSLRSAVGGSAIGSISGGNLPVGGDDHNVQKREPLSGFLEEILKILGKPDL